MNNDQFRICQNQDEICHILMLAQGDPHPVAFWQQEGGMRMTFKGRITVVATDLNQFLVSPIDLDRQLSPHGLFTFYCKHEQQSVLFKVNLQCEQDRVLAFTMPSELRIYERRSDPRYIFHEGERPLVQLEQTSVYGVTRFIEAPLVDLSSSGMALAITKRDCSLFQTDAQILVGKIGKMTLGREISARVVYIGHLSLREDLPKTGGVQETIYRVGLRFERQVDIFHLIHQLRDPQN